MSGYGTPYGLPHANELEAVLQKEGINPDKYWDYNKMHNNLLINKLVCCYKQGTSNRRFNRTVHEKIVNRRIKAYFIEIKKMFPELLYNAQ